MTFSDADIHPVTHIFRDFVEFEQTKTFTGLCGSTSRKANFLSVREIVGAEPQNPNEVRLDDDELKKYRETLCPDCANSEEFAMLVLAI